MNPPDYSYMASFQYDNESVNFCAGILVSPVWILTAAHCLYETDRKKLKDPTKTYVIAGVGSCPEDLHEDGTYQRRICDAFHPHDEYDHRTRLHDIGLVKVKIKFIYNGFISYGVFQLYNDDLAEDKCADIVWSEGDDGSPFVCPAYSDPGFVLDTKAANIWEKLGWHRENREKGHIVGVSTFGHGSRGLRIPTFKTLISPYRDWAHDRIQGGASTSFHSHLPYPCLIGAIFAFYMSSTY